MEQVKKAPDVSSPEAPLNPVPHLTHYQDVVIRDGALLRELMGRIVWANHDAGQICVVDFPGLSPSGLGFVARLFGDEEAVLALRQKLQPLADHKLVGLPTTLAVPATVTQWGVTYRSNQRRSPSRERRHRARAAKRAQQAGLPAPEWSEPPQGRAFANNEHSIRMQSKTSGGEVFPMAISRMIIRDSSVAATTRLAGKSYGLGMPVPVIGVPGDAGGA